TYSLTYSAGAHGSVTGSTSQTVGHGSNGTQVTAVPAAGYRFVSWSDGVTTAARTDASVTGDLTVTATFARVGVPAFTATVYGGTTLLSTAFESDSGAQREIWIAYDNSRSAPVEFVNSDGSVRLAFTSDGGAVDRAITVESSGGTETSMRGASGTNRISADLSNLTGWVGSQGTLELEYQVTQTDGSLTTAVVSANGQDETRLTNTRTVTGGTSVVTYISFAMSDSLATIAPDGTLTV